MKQYLRRIPKADPLPPTGAKSPLRSSPVTGRRSSIMISLTIGVMMLSLILLLSACEIPRPPGAGDLPTTLTSPTPLISPVPGEPITPTTETGQPADIAVGPEAAIAPAPEAVEPGQVILKLEPQAAIQARSAELGGDNVVTAGIDTLDQRLREIGATGLEPVVEEVAEALPNENFESLAVEVADVSQLYTVSFSPDQNPQEVAQTLDEDPTVQYAEPNYLAGITAGPPVEPLLPPLTEGAGPSHPALLTPNDPYYRYQWHMDAIQMPTAWDNATGQDVIVAIIDTGIDFRAPDLATTNRLTGYDFVSEDADPTDDQGHGTHVAGTIAQSTNNALGVAGVAFNARLLPVKVLGANGQGSYDNIIKGIVYAVDQGARVINMSLAGRNGSQALQEAIAYAHSRNVVVVAAAGNSGSTVEFPAAYDDFVLAVGATRYDNTLTSYSNFGPQIDLVAPGGDIDVDQNNDGYADGVLQQSFRTAGTYTYLFFEGTSMASPHVAGLAALILSRQPNASPAEVEAILSQTAINLGPADRFGAGLVQAERALGAIPGPAGPTATVTPVPPPVTLTPTPTSGVVPQPPTLTPTWTPVPAQPPTLTPTPTQIPAQPPTLTPTPPPIAPGGGTELLLNSGFEGNDGWVFGDTPIRGGYDTATVFAGGRAARLGLTSGRDRFSYSSVWQRVTIPPEARQVTLRANVYPISQDTPGRDIQYIMVLNEGFRVIKTLSEGLSNSQTWENRTYDLSDLSGRTIYIYFSVLNRGDGRPSAMFVDDVSLTWVQ